MRKVFVSLVIAGSLISGPVFATNVIHPEDFGCNGFDNVDDTVCWQNTLDAALSDVDQTFGTIEAAGTVEDGPGCPGSKCTARYIISNTLLVREARRGAIDGKGSTFLWKGPHATQCDITEDPNVPVQSQEYEDMYKFCVPMWLFEDVNSLQIKNMYIHVNYPTNPLDTAFEFTNWNGDPPLNKPDPCAGATQPPPSGDRVAPGANIIDHVSVEGVDLGGLQFGVRFSKRYGFDCNNELQSINDSWFMNVEEAAISIEHSQSGFHRLRNLGNSGAAGAEASRNVFARFGNFIFENGAGGGFTWADFDLIGVGGPITILNAVSENSKRFIWAPGPSAHGFEVSVIDGRFATNQLHSDGEVIHWQKRGRLSLQGMLLDGLFGTVSPKIRFEPHPVNEMEGHLEVSNMKFAWAGSADEEFLDLGEFARLHAYGNSCFNSQLDTVPCSKLAGGMDGVRGQALAALATRPGPDGHWTYCIDCQPNTRPCASGGTGSFAVRSDGAWDCGGIPGAITRDTEWDSTAEVNAATTDDDFVTLTGAQVLTNKDLRSLTNLFPDTSFVSFAFDSTGLVGWPRYCAPNGSLCVPAANWSGLRVPVPASDLSTFSCNASAIPTNNYSWVITAMKGTGTTSLTCTIAPQSTSCTPASGPVSFSAGDKLSFKVEKNGSPQAAVISCSAYSTP